MKTLAKIVLIAIFALLAPRCVFAQTTTPPAAVQPINWTVSGIGMPGNLATALAAQWTAAATAAAADSSEVAFVNAQKDAVTAKLSWFATNAPTIPVTVRVQRRVIYTVPTQPQAQFMFNVSPVSGFVN